MGKLVVGFAPIECFLDDRTLAHVQLAIVSKIRNHEVFLLETPTPRRAAALDIWISMSLPMSFEFDSARLPSINTHWVRALVTAAAEEGRMRILTEREAELYLAGVRMPDDRHRRGVTATKHIRVVGPRERRRTNR